MTRRQAPGSFVPLGGVLFLLLNGLIAACFFFPLLCCPNTLCQQNFEIASEAVPECPICHGTNRITLYARLIIKQDLRVPMWR